MADRVAQAAWRGDLFAGAGTVTAVSSGLFTAAPVTWVGRTTETSTTSPEELIAAAHAACFCMAFANELSSRGHQPDQLDVTATCTFVGGQGVTTMVLEVIGRVPGIDDAAFQEIRQVAEGSCPVSNALRGNVEITVAATLA